MLNPITPTRSNAVKSRSSATSLCFQHDKENLRPLLLSPLPQDISPSNIIYPSLPLAKNLASPQTPVSACLSARTRANISRRRTRPQSCVFATPSRPGHADRLHDIFTDPYRARYKSRNCDALIPSPGGHCPGSVPLQLMPLSLAEHSDSVVSPSVGSEIERTITERRADRLSTRSGALLRASSDEWTGDEEFFGIRHESVDHESSPTQVVKSSHAISRHSSCVPSRRGATMTSPRTVGKTGGFHLTWHPPADARPIETRSEKKTWSDLGPVTPDQRRAVFKAHRFYGSSSTPLRRQHGLLDKAFDEADDDRESTSARPKKVTQLSPKVKIHRGSSRDEHATRSKTRKVVSRQRSPSYDDQDILGAVTKNAEVEQ